MRRSPFPTVRVADQPQTVLFTLEFRGKTSRQSKEEVDEEEDNPTSDRSVLHCDGAEQLHNSITSANLHHSRDRD